MPERTNMFAKLDKLRTDLQKAIDKRNEADEKVRQLEERLKQEEAEQIVADVNSCNMSPEQLNEFLALVKSGKLQEMMKACNQTVQSTSSYNTKNDTEDMDNEDE